MGKILDFFKNLLRGKKQKQLESKINKPENEEQTEIETTSEYMLDGTKGIFTKQFKYEINSMSDQNIVTLFQNAFGCGEAIAKNPKGRELAISLCKKILSKENIETLSSKDDVEKALKILNEKIRDDLDSLQFNETVVDDEYNKIEQITKIGILPNGDLLHSTSKANLNRGSNKVEYNINGCVYSPEGLEMSKLEKHFEPIGIYNKDLLSSIPTIKTTYLQSQGVLNVDAWGMDETPITGYTIFRRDDLQSAVYNIQKNYGGHESDCKLDFPIENLNMPESIPMQAYLEGEIPDEEMSKIMRKNSVLMEKNPSKLKTIAEESKCDKIKKYAQRVGIIPRENERAG